MKTKCVLNTASYSVKSLSTL